MSSRECSIEKVTALRGAARYLLRHAETLEPIRTALCWRMRGQTLAHFSVGGVYRRRNAWTVQALIKDLPAGVVSAWWALDASHPNLDYCTVGVGPGTRPELLNRVARELPTSRDSYLVLCDDDWQFVKGGFGDLIRAAAFAQLDLCQPSHCRGSLLSWGVTRHRTGSFVRVNRFVEQGPVVVLAPLARQVLVPLPEDLGMGWGMEVRWAAESSIRLGIVDGIEIRHLGRVGQHYDAGDQDRQARRLLVEAGVDWPDLQREVDRWRWTQRSPSWRVHAAGDPAETGVSEASPQ